VLIKLQNCTPKEAMFEETIARVRATGELWFRAPMWIISALALALLHGLAPAETQWQLMAWYSIILILSTSLSNTPLTFFTGQGAGVVQTLEYLFRGTPLPDPEKPNADAEERRRSEVGFWTLMPSAFVTWVFAKSINNSALYGTRWGLMGGVVYAGWYLSFPSAAAFGDARRARAPTAALDAARVRVRLATEGAGCLAPRRRRPACRRARGRRRARKAHPAMRPGPLPCAPARAAPLQATGSARARGTARCRPRSTRATAARRPSSSA
jgi:hypothetical protein